MKWGRVACFSSRLLTNASCVSHEAYAKKSLLFSAPLSPRLSIFLLENGRWVGFLFLTDSYARLASISHSWLPFFVRVSQTWPIRDAHTHSLCHQLMSCEYLCSLSSVLTPAVCLSFHFCLCGFMNHTLPVGNRKDVPKGYLGPKNMEGSNPSRVFLSWHLSVFFWWSVWTNGDNSFHKFSLNFLQTRLKHSVRCWEKQGTPANS